MKDISKRLDVANCLLIGRTNQWVKIPWSRPGQHGLQVSLDNFDCDVTLQKLATSSSLLLFCKHNPCWTLHDSGDALQVPRLSFINLEDHLQVVSWPIILQKGSQRSLFITVRKNVLIYHSDKSNKPCCWMETYCSSVPTT